MTTNLLKGFKSFHEKYYEGEAPLMKELVADGQDPDYFIISCIDSQTNPGMLFSPKPGTFFTYNEWKSLISQTVTSNTGRGGRCKLPRVFTEQGVAMLSSVLRSPQAVQVNIAIMRTFVRLRQILSTYEDVLRKLEEHDRHIANLYAHVEQLLKFPEPNSKPIGYIWPKNKDNNED